MPHPARLEEPLSRIAKVLGDYGYLLAALAAALALAGLIVPGGNLATGALAAASALGALVVLGQLVMFHRRRQCRKAAGTAGTFAEADPTPCFVTAAEGDLLYLNAAARKRFRNAEGDTLGRVFGDILANPAGVLFRLQEKALAQGAAREDLIARGGHIRLSALLLGSGATFWRFDEIARTSLPGRGLESVGLPMLIVAKSGAILSLNEPARQMLGGEADSLDRVISDLPLRPGDVHEVLTPGGPRPCRVAAVEVADGCSEVYFLAAGPGGMRGSGREFDVLEELPVGLLRLQADGAIASANRLARELLRGGAEGAADDLAGVALSERLEGLGRPVRDWIDEAAMGRGLGRPEVLRVRDAETDCFLQVTLSRGEGPGEVRLIAVLNDATELKTLEAQFVQSQKMQAIGQLAGGVAHDFNNLLTAISGHCDLMLLRHDQGDPDYGDLVQIHQNANRAASLVGQLLAFSRKQTLQPQVIDLRDTLSDLTHLLNRLVGERIALTLHHDPGLPPIRADRRQLEQVIMNLVVNARDAMADGGEIRIESSTRVLGDELHRDRAKVPAGHYVVVKVEDHGSGIAPDKLTKIFEPFYTTKRTGEGTGLGLSTAYGIVKQSGGFIFVDSVVGTGTVFTLYFPAHDGPAEAAAPAQHPAARWTNVSAMSPPQNVAAAEPAVAGEADSDCLERLAEAGAAAGTAKVAAGANGTRVAAVGAGASRSVAAAVARPAARRGGGQGAADAVPAGVAAAGSRNAAGPGAVTPAPVAAPAAARETGAPKQPGEGVILLVEDEAPVRAFASRALRMRGYTVIEAENAEEALATLEDPALEVDLFVTDVIMPGLDGPSWVRKALEARPRVKVVFVSGYAEDSFGEEQARIPNSVFLPKPFSLSELTATVQDQIH